MVSVSVCTYDSGSLETDQAFEVSEPKQKCRFHRQPRNRGWTTFPYAGQMVKVRGSFQFNVVTSGKETNKVY